MHFEMKESVLEATSCLAFTHDKSSIEDLLDRSPSIFLNQETRNKLSSKHLNIRAKSAGILRGIFNERPDPCILFQTHPAGAHRRRSADVVVPTIGYTHAVEQACHVSRAAIRVIGEDAAGDYQSIAYRRGEGCGTTITG